MWWRFLTFCVLVTLILFVVLSCIHGRPAIHLFFHRCCEEDIENDQVLYENFGNNFLRERLVGADIAVDDNDRDSFVSESDVENVINAMRDKINVHDPSTRTKIYTEKSINNFTNTLQSFSKDLETKLNDLDIDGNTTVNNYSRANNSSDDSVKANDSTQQVLEEVTSNNDVSSELDANESVEMTTEKQVKIKSTFPIKLIDVHSSFFSEKGNYSEQLIAAESDKMIEKSQ